MAEEPSCAELPRSKTYLGRAGEGGGSAAILVDYCDGVKRVTKVMGNPQRNIVLVNELVTARLAALLEAPCPEGWVVRIDERVLDDARAALGELASAEAGRCFGSVWSEALYSPGVDVCRDAVNRGELAGLIVLYTWCRNTDWKPSHLLYRPRGGGVEVLGVDHGHCFDYTWDASIRDAAASTPVRSLGIVASVVHADDFEPFLQRLRQLDRDAITPCLDVPPEWGVGREQLAALEAYLVESNARVIETVRDAFPPVGR